jgi:hypothetical protein
MGRLWAAVLLLLVLASSKSAAVVQADCVVTNGQPQPGCQDARDAATQSKGQAVKAQVPLAQQRVRWEPQVRGGCWRLVG